MSEHQHRPSTRRSVDLGDIPAGGSRHTGRRSAVHVAAGCDGHRALVGTAGGDVRAFDGEARERWHDAGEESIVAMATLDGAVLTGARGATGAVRALDPSTGERRWRHEAADEVGPPTKQTRFLLPFVADIVTDSERAYVAARRYERRDGDRHFESVVYGFDPDGAVAWRHHTDASPIALDTDSERVAVAYNRCPGDHQHGLVVFDADDGRVRYDWDPGTDGDRRIGDVSLVADGVIVCSHGDYRGYRLEDGGAVRWRVDLATPRAVGDETLYAYPNHVHATESGALFVTGNTYPEEGRETNGRHPREHTAFGITPDGERRFTARAGGFASGIGADGDRVAVPVAQNFRVRDADAHGLSVLDVVDGPVATVDTEGGTTAAALDGDRVAVVEEPVRYHDEGVEHGAYRLHAVTLD